MLACMRSDDLLTTPTVAAELGISPATLRYWRHVRQGPPFVKLGKHVRYVRKDLRVWVAANRCEPAQSAEAS